MLSCNTNIAWHIPTWLLQALLTASIAELSAKHLRSCLVCSLSRAAQASVKQLHFVVADTLHAVIAIDSTDDLLQFTIRRSI